MSTRRPRARKVAELKIKGGGKMTDAERKDIADWLKKQAIHLIRAGNAYTKGVYRAGFNYLPR